MDVRSAPLVLFFLVDYRIDLSQLTKPLILTDCPAPESGSSSTIEVVDVVEGQSLAVLASETEFSFLLGPGGSNPETVDLLRPSPARLSSPCLHDDTDPPLRPSKRQYCCPHGSSGEPVYRYLLCDQRLRSGLILHALSRMAATHDECPAFRRLYVYCPVPFAI